MSEPEPHPGAPSGALNLTHTPWHSNRSHVSGAEEAPSGGRDGWKHPITIATLITAAASLITALTPLLIRLL